ncbi:SH3 domain-containing protein [Dichotomopilus funicola]|uniref:SH3 domain-containing protein n=1 Tax=Dichotomopilus funicola TaxID=1934379 RepID=A0AAN6V8Y9_9PEZI|nr:SH3 domain-containing protein [Dichotomopilus funicola]
MSESRQRAIETNRSLRVIKNELETLLEKGVIDDAAFDSIHSLLPAESPLSGAGARSTNSTPAPAAAAPVPSPALPTRNNNANSSAPAPPSYAQSTASPPALPTRNNPPAPPAPPAKPVLTHARALYRYTASDARDCSFERDDRIAVHEYMNADWWMGRNLRTNQEGIFPKNYVVAEEQAQKTAPAHTPIPAPYQQPQYASPAPAQQHGGYPIAPVPVQGGYPAAPPPGQAYQQDQQQGGDGKESKMGEHGKKFGKKLGNAAIFGAGATIGSNIVNSIF